MLRHILLCFQWLVHSVGGSTQHGRNMAKKKHGVERPPDQTILVPHFVGNFDEGVAEGIRRQRSRLGRKRIDPALIGELQAELRVHWQDSSSRPKQKDGIAFIKGRVGQEIGRRVIKEQIVAPVHHKLWPR
jgi:hypothetical protein